MIATIVDWGALGQTIIAAIVGGVGVAFTFSLAIYGVARIVEGERDPNSGPPIAFALLALLGLAATAAAIAFGIIVMATD